MLKITQFNLIRMSMTSKGFSTKKFKKITQRQLLLLYAPRSNKNLVVELLFA